MFKKRIVLKPLGYSFPTDTWQHRLSLKELPVYQPNEYSRLDCNVQFTPWRIRSGSSVAANYRQFAGKNAAVKKLTAIIEQLRRVGAQQKPSNAARLRNPRRSPHTYL